jgi:hypothetical protein
MFVYLVGLIFTAIDFAMIGLVYWLIGRFCGFRPDFTFMVAFVALSNVNRILAKEANA